MVRLAAPGAAHMAGYRLYFMDRFSGHIDNRREFLADGDAQAVAIAQLWHDGSPMELWLGEHKLRRWEATPLAPLPSGEATSTGE
jgi:hypothetical protein